jgi:hypothetical protein
VHSQLDSSDLGIDEDLDAAAEYTWKEGWDAYRYEAYDRQCKKAIACALATFRVCEEQTLAIGRDFAAFAQKNGSSLGALRYRAAQFTDLAADILAASAHAERTLRQICGFDPFRPARPREPFVALREDLGLRTPPPLDFPYARLAECVAGTDPLGEVEEKLGIER